MDYITALKEKYGIDTGPKSAFVTLEDYAKERDKVSTELETIWKKSLKRDRDKKIVEHYVNFIGKYRIIGLWEDPVKNTLIKWIGARKGRIVSGQGYVYSSNDTNIFLKGVISDKIHKISRHLTMLTPFTESQLAILKMQRDTT